ncbi:MAG: hypothetical protein ACLPP2_06490 [Thermoplasmata archaeon]
MATPVQPTPVKPNLFRRALLPIVSLIVLVIAFFIVFEYPQYSIDALCLLIAWFAVNFAWLHLSRRSRVPSDSAGGSAGSSPLPSSAPATPPPPSPPRQGGS